MQMPAGRRDLGGRKEDEAEVPRSLKGVGRHREILEKLSQIVTTRVECLFSLRATLGLFAERCFERRDRSETSSCSLPSRQALYMSIA